MSQKMTILAGWELPENWQMYQVAKSWRRFHPLRTASR
jgi:hypothetical protein